MITKGEWIQIWDSESISTHIGVNSPGKRVCQINSSNSEAEANAQLIADAGNTYNKTGLTPSELSEKLDNLKTLLVGRIDTLSVNLDKLTIADISSRKEGKIEGELKAYKELLKLIQ